MKRIIFLLLVTLNTLLTSAETNRDGLIAHGCGSIDRLWYTNSKEALLFSISRGYKYIEIDLCVTSDGHIILAHDWDMFNTHFVKNGMGDTPLSLKQFKDSKIYNYLTPMSLIDFLEIIKDYPEVIIVTDKISNPKIIDSYFRDYKERTLIEAFSLEDYNELKRLGYTPMFSTEPYYAFCKSVENLIEGLSPIDFVATFVNTNLNDIERLKCISDFRVALYTSDSEEFVDEHLGLDVDLIYTNNLEP